MRPITRVYSLVVADPDGVCLSQTPAAGGVQSLTIGGILSVDGTVTLAAPQNITITGGAESARTFTITGITSRGFVESEELAGPNTNTVSTVNSFKTVTSVTVDDNTVGAITVGVNNTGSMPWVPLDRYATQFDYSYLVDVTTATFEIESTLDLVQDESITPTVTETVEASGSIDVTGVSTVPCVAVRVKVTAFTAGDITFKVMQAGGLPC